MSNVKNIEWVSTHGRTEVDSIFAIERELGIKFPKDYTECSLENHGGHPLQEIFDFQGHKEAVFNRLLSFNPEKQSYLLSVYEDVSDRLVEGIIPFASDPFGNLICFDYRASNAGEPSIVFWDHEIAALEPRKAIKSICNSFTELLEKLYMY